MSNGIDAFVNQVICGNSADVLRDMPSQSVHAVITSPPYWNLIDYQAEGQIGQTSYERYISQLLEVWRECYRVLIPNGKLCINTPMVPVSKEQDSSGHTRTLKNINNDIEASLLNDDRSNFQRFSLYLWQKQTSVKMFGSYPYPPNLYEDNTIEFINVMVKPGKPRKLPKEVKEASRLSQEMWLNLTMQVWPMYPEDVSRSGGHPAPFPVALPQRLIMMYIFAASPDYGFEGDIVLDPFNGSGATCVAAKSSNRRFIGCDINHEYCEIARHRLAPHRIAIPPMMLERIKMRSVTAKEPEPVLFEGMGDG